MSLRESPTQIFFIPPLCPLWTHCIHWYSRIDVLPSREPRVLQFNVLGEFRLSVRRLVISLDHWRQAQDREDSWFWQGYSSLRDALGKHEPVRLSLSLMRPYPAAELVIY